MEEQQKNIDDIFRQSLSDYREVPPAAAWDKVAAKLDGEDNRRRGTFLRWPWTMMVLMLFVGGAWFALTLYGKWTGAEHSAENAVAHTNTRTDGRKTSSPGTTPIASDPAKAAADRNELPGNEANQAIASASGNLSTANSDLSDDKPAQTIPVVATPSQYSGKPTRTIQSKTAAKASVSHNSLTSTPSTTSTTTENSPAVAPYSNVVTDGAARENAPLATIKPRIKKTTVYGKMIVTEEIPENVFEADLAAITKTSVGTRTTAAQKNTAAPEQELLPKEPIVSTTPKAKQPPPVVQKAPINQSNTSLEQAQPVTSPLKKNAVAANGKPAISEKSKHESNTQPSEAVANTDPGTVSATMPKKQSQKGKPKTTITASAVTTSTATVPNLPVKTTVASATPKPSPSASVPQNATVPKKEVSPKQVKPALSAPAKPSHQEALVAKETSNSSKGKQVGNEQAVTASAVIPATGMPTAVNAKKQTHKVKPIKTPGTTPVAAATTVRAMSPLVPLAVKEAMLATKEPARPTPSASVTLASQPKAQKADAVAADAQPPTLSSADGAAGTQVADSAAAVARPKYPKSFSVAALAGYEFGMQAPAPGRIAAGARILMHVSPKASIGLQPSIRYGTVASQKLTDEKVYQNSVINVDRFTSLAFSPSVRNSVDTLYHYVVRESFDSIVVGSTTAGGKSFEFELPLIVNYQINKSWHIYGGPSLNFGGKLTTTDPSIQTFTVTRRDSLVQSVPMPESEFVNYFGKSSLEPYSNYQPSSARLQDPGSVRFGYILGFGYDWKRIMFDASMHQQVSGYSDVAEPFKKVYSSPYLRLNVGYMLFPTKKSQKNEME